MKVKAFKNQQAPPIAGPVLFVPCPFRFTVPETSRAKTHPANPVKDFEQCKYPTYHKNVKVRIYKHDICSNNFGKMEFGKRC
jgi:hypothetical protein